MTSYSLPSTHIHVSERETAHRWPDGRWDDAKWEDCAWDVAIEWARAIGYTKIPATHKEAEALRAASGEDTWSGSNVFQVRNGLQRRYGISTKPPVYGFEAIWNQLVPGTVASVSGLMSRFSYNHRLRRHDRPFAGTHTVLVFRLDDLPRVWWCNPQAPDGYRGEWVSKSELYAFITGANLGALIGRIPASKTHPLDGPIKKLKGYIANLEGLVIRTVDQSQKLATYRKRLADYIRRRNNG